MMPLHSLPMMPLHSLLNSLPMLPLNLQLEMLLEMQPVVLPLGLFVELLY
jgi:hypothetical protein